MTVDMTNVTMYLLGEGAHYATHIGHAPGDIVVRSVVEFGAGVRWYVAALGDGDELDSHAGDWIPATRDGDILTALEREVQP